MYCIARNFKVQTFCCFHVSLIHENTYRIRTNIDGYNIWQFVEIMDLVRYFDEIIQKQLGSQLICYRKKYWRDLNLAIV